MYEISGSVCNIKWKYDLNQFKSGGDISWKQLQRYSVVHSVEMDSFKLPENWSNRLEQV